MKKRSILLVAFGLVLAGMCGCNKQDAPTAGVAVVDLDRVAKAIGWEQSFQDAIKDKERELNQKVSQVKSSLEGELKGLQDEFGVDATQEQKTQFGQYTMQANAQIQKVAESAKREFANYRSMLINQFREKVRPQAEKVAKSKGLGLILTKTEAVFYVDSEQDITSVVIDAMAGIDSVVEPPVNTEPEAE